MKIALVHDYIKEYGGAERVLEALHELYPDAPIFTSVYLPEFLGPHRKRFADWNIKTSWLQHLPFKQKLISPMRLLSPFAFQSFDFSKFDVVIVSATGAYFPNMLKTKKRDVIARREERATRQSPARDRHALLAMTGKKQPIHVCYCHTPPRYLYGYATARAWKKNVLFRILGEVASHVLRLVDFRASQHVDCYVANSEEVKARIQKFYRKDALVIYPPVEIGVRGQGSGISEKKKNNLSPNALNPNLYYIAGGRLARPKHIDLIVRACLELGVSLKVFGKGFAGYGEELKELAESNVSYRHSGERSDSRISQTKSDPGQARLAAKRARMTKNSIAFVGEVSDEEKWKLLQGAKAYIFASEDEDFGILPVEAMAAGTPVIAFRSGGVKETVVEGKTGLFFDELTVASLTNAIKQLDKHTFSQEACRRQAENFSSETFKKSMRELIESIA